MNRTNGEEAAMLYARQEVPNTHMTALADLVDRQDSSIAELEASVKELEADCAAYREGQSLNAEASFRANEKLRALTAGPGDEKVREAIERSEPNCPTHGLETQSGCADCYALVLASALRAKQEELEAVSLDHNYGQCAFRKHAEAAEKALAAAQERIKTLEGR